MILRKPFIIVFLICLLSGFIGYLPVLTMLYYGSNMARSLISTLSKISLQILYILLFILVYLLCKPHNLRREYKSILITSFIASVLGLVLGNTIGIVALSLWHHHSISLLSMLFSIVHFIITQLIVCTFSSLKYVFAVFTATTIAYLSVKGEV